ncbi:MAG: hypothetical protein R3Y64_02945 [Peptostreptococcaceae bacterium]
MNFTLGKEIAVSTSYVKSNPAVPIFNGEEIYGAIYHIEIGYNEQMTEKNTEYIIVDYKDFNLSDEKKTMLLELANKYCDDKNISDRNIELLDNEEAENFVEKIFNNMKVIKGLITKKGQ